MHTKPSFVIVALLLLCVCSCCTDSNPNSDFEPGGRLYVGPGIYHGLYTESNDSAYEFLTTRCTVHILEADSRVVGYTVIDSTGEKHSFSGPYSIFVYNDYSTPFQYWLQEIASSDHRYQQGPLEFRWTKDTLTYATRLLDQKVSVQVEAFRE